MTTGCLHVLSAPRARRRVPPIAYAALAGFTTLTVLGLLELLRWLK